MYNIQSLEEVMLEIIDKARLVVREGKLQEAEAQLDTVPSGMTVFELTKEQEIVYE